MAAIDPSNRGLRLATRYVVLGLIAVIFIFTPAFMLMSSFSPPRSFWPTPPTCAPSCR